MSTTIELRPVPAELAGSQDIIGIHGKIENGVSPFFQHQLVREMLVFSKTDKNIEITGKTFYAKEAIKAVGGKWDAATQRWTISANANAEVLKKLEDAAKEGAEKDEEEKKKARQEAKKAAAYARTPEGIAARLEEERQKILWCLEQKKKTGAYHWICCEKCTVVDWGRQHTSCMACADWSGQSWNTFCVRGRRYTGD
jgi:hypothetical protein